MSARLASMSNSLPHWAGVAETFPAARLSCASAAGIYTDWDSDSRPSRAASRSKVMIGLTSQPSDSAATISNIEEGRLPCRAYM